VRIALAGSYLAALRSSSMSKISWTRPKVAAVIGGGVVVVGVVVGIVLAGGQSAPTASPTPKTSVLSASYAKSVGFPKTFRPATKTKVTDTKGCSDSNEVVYEDTAGDTAMISDTLDCSSSTSAASALASARKQIQTDPHFTLPTQLGTSAFATASNNPEYLVAWQAGTRVAIVAMDVNVKATSAKTAPKPLSTSQQHTLIDAAVQQNALYN
jgi:hypothetical protein